MAIPIVGAANSSTPVEVEAGTKALRATLRPDAYGNLGHYLAGEQRGPMLGGLAAASPIVAFRYFGGGVCLVKRILFEMNTTFTAFTAGSAQFNIFVARSYTASDSGGVAMFAGGDQQKLRSSMGDSQVDFRSSTTGTLTAGTRTLDGQPLCSISVPISTAQDTAMVPAQTPIFDQRLGEHPLVLAQDEGWVLQATVPATGTWTYSMHCYWEELASY